MRVRIIGGIGSGKTYLSKKLSRKFRIKYYLLDSLFWNNDSLDYCAKNPPVVRDKRLKDILSKPDWIIEGVYYEQWVSETFKDADFFVYLDVSSWKRYFRVFKRLILSKFGKADSFEKNLSDSIKLIKLDLGWKKGIVKAGKSAKIFKSADNAFEFIKSAHKN